VVLSRKARVLERHAVDLIRRKNILGWEEGTQGHLPRAPAAFARFLRGWRADHPEWHDVPVWLIDTGDRTAFGDRPSIEAGARYLSMWSAALGDCPVRTLYGNHDMWPQTLPAFNRTEVRVQRGRVRATQGWAVDDWIRKPLSAPIPGTDSWIDLYAIDTIAWGALWGVVRNTRAVGQLRGAEVLHLQGRLQGAARRGRTGLRILAMHHPLSFPWSKSEVGSGFASTMKLLKDERWAAIFRNDQDVPPGIGPWAHLILSGHTHLAHPAFGVSRDVTSISQGPLGPYQLQLVGGALMLNRSSMSRQQDAPAAPETRDVAGFEPATVGPHPSQAQILSFYVSADPEEPWIDMTRTPVYSDDAGRHYVAGKSDSVTLHYRL
jgi:hypothetical protein